MWLVYYYGVMVPTEMLGLGVGVVVGLGVGVVVGLGVGLHRSRAGVMYLVERDCPPIAVPIFTATISTKTTGACAACHMCNTTCM